MKIMIKFFSFPSTPIQRLGALGFVSSLLIMSWTAIEWQLTEGFVRYDTHLVQMPPPGEAPDGHRWEREAGFPHGWRLIDRDCLAEQQQAPQSAANPDAAALQQQRLRLCTRKEVPGYTRSFAWRPNWRGYLEALVRPGSYRRAYGDQTMAAATLFWLAFLAYFGLMDRLLSWIRTGRL